MKSGNQCRAGIWHGRGGVATLALAATLATGTAIAQETTSIPTPQTAQQVTAPAVPVAPAQGGTVRGKVLAGATGKPGTTPLPGVAITATNSLTGRKYTTATDIDGVYAMAIPRNGRYVVKAELAGFATMSQEVVIGGTEPNATAAKVSDFGLELASRVAAAEARQTAASGATSASLTRGLQNLNLSAGGDASTEDASASSTGGNTGAALPTLAGLGDSAAASENSIAVSGQTGQTNQLANFSEDEIRSRVEDAVAQARASGMLPQGGGDPTSAIVSAIGGMMGGGGFMVMGGPGGGGPGGGGRGGRGGGGGFGAFRNFNPAQPHGTVFYQGGNSALNSAPWSPTLLPQVNPSAFQNRFGVSLAGSPYIPGLTTPNTKQFVFVNFSGQRNLNAFLPNPVRVPTAAERAGDFSNSFQRVGNTLQPVQLYDAVTHLPIIGNKLANSSTGISQQAQNLLNTYYPACNIPANCNSTDPTVYNYQTISNAGNNNVQLNARYIRNFGQNNTGRFGRFGGSGAGGNGAGARGAGGNANRNRNAPPTLRQNINAGFNYAHSAQDNRNIFLALGGASNTEGYGLNVGYTIGYGRLSNNASVNWNRSSSATRNYFTDTGNNPTATLGINVPNQAAAFADPRFYNGVPRISITNFAGLSNTAPSQSINQTVSFSDFVSWRHTKHNMRFGFDIRRVHADSIGGNNPLGQFQFTGYQTESTADRTGTNTTATTGSGFADFLLGLPTQTSLQAGLNKIYLRDNVYDLYAQDDFRVLPNVTLNMGLRYEYFGPYTEKNNRLVNLDHNADFTVVSAVLPNQRGAFSGDFPRSLVNPDRTMFSPRIGVAYRPKGNSSWLKDTVVRGGYGINYNTGQFATFARQLAFQPPFASTQTNTLSTSGCSTITLASGFNCSTLPVQNNYSVNKDYRLGMVQVYNLNLQRSLGSSLVLNIGYNGSKGSDLDIIRAPNHTVSGVTTANAQAFTYEDSLAASNLNQLVISAQRRQQKGIALSAFYQYSHSIDNASSFSGATGTTAQNDQRLDLERSNSSFDVRHRLTLNWVLELPFGPNRAFLNKGGAWSKLLDGFNLSGDGTFASGTFFTPQYSSNAAQALAGGYYTLRPDREFTQPIAGPGTVGQFFNTAAFVAPRANNGLNGFGSASRNSIAGPGTLTINTALSRNIPLGETRSLEARMSATNVFNTVQYNGINTTVNSANYGKVTSAAAMRSLQFQARYRF